MGHREIFLFVFVVVLTGCVERYDLSLPAQNKVIVVEAEISDRSYNETLEYPSRGRRFSVRLSYTSDVDFIVNDKISDAIVSIIDDQGASVTYEETNDEPGTYEIIDDDFSAQPERSYRLDVVLPTGDHISSTHVDLPMGDIDMGDIEGTEVEYLEYDYVHGERVIRDRQGLDLSIQLAGSPKNMDRYWRWDFEAMYVFEAIFAPPRSDERFCWIYDSHYLSDYRIEKELHGSYAKDLFRLRTKGNDKLYSHFSTLIIQSLLHSEYYQFLDDLKRQNALGGLYDSPPYNLPTNLKVESGNSEVIGYFSVVKEDARRWTFDPSALSYRLPNNQQQECQEIDMLRPFTGEPDVCRHCLLKSKNATNIPPHWW